MTKGIIAAAVVMLVASASSAAPYRPSDDATVLVTVPPAAASTQTAFRTAQNALAANPNDLDLALEVARAAIRDGRASADPRRYGQAQAALAPWWSIPNPPMSVRVLRAIVRQSLHDFAGAEADLEAILRLDPRNGQARLTRAFVRQTVGSLADAKDDCRRLPPSVGALAAAVCWLRVQALTGSAASALERLDQVIKIYGKVDPLVLRWAQAVGADMAAMLGQTEAADLLFSEATKDGCWPVAARPTSSICVWRSPGSALTTRGRRIGPRCWLTGLPRRTPAVSNFI